MEITDVRVRKTYPEGKMRAIVSVTFDDQFVVHDIKVIEGQSGFYCDAQPKNAGWRIQGYCTSH